MEFKIKEISLLEGVASDKTDAITIKIPLSKVEPELIDSIDKLCKTHKGKHRLRIQLLDYNNKISLKMLSADRKVLADNEFIQELARLKLDYKLN